MLASKLYACEQVVGLSNEGFWLAFGSNKLCRCQGWHWHQPGIQATCRELWVVGSTFHQTASVHNPNRLFRAVSCVS